MGLEADIGSQAGGGVLLNVGQSVLPVQVAPQSSALIQDVQEHPSRNATWRNGSSQTGISGSCFLPFAGLDARAGFKYCNTCSALMYAPHQPNDTYLNRLHLHTKHPVLRLMFTSLHYWRQHPPQMPVGQNPKIANASNREEWTRLTQFGLEWK